MDANKFSADISTVSSLIQMAFQFWKKEFNSVKLLSMIRVASENFIQSDCKQSNFDIRFELGKLSPDQVKLIPNINKTIGRAIRTDYDTINLRGKGFIYLAPDMGENKLNLMNLIKHHWWYDTILLLALIHELGHVFGLHDIGHSFMHAFTTFMNENFLESIVTTTDGDIEEPDLSSEYKEKSITLINESLNFIMKSSFFRFNIENPIYWSSNALADCYGAADRERLIDYFKFLGIPDDYGCVKYYYHQNKITIMVKNEFDKTSDWEEMGVINYQIKKLTIFDMAAVDFKGGVTVIIDNTKQQVFDKDEEGSLPAKDGYLGPQIIYDEATGTYVNHKTGETKPVVIHFQPMGIKLYGEVNNSLVPLRSW